MESLALVVSLMALAELVFGLATITFAALARFRGRFRRTAIVLLVLLAVETVWALWINFGFGMPPLIALGIAVVLFWWPRRRTSS